jgi:hypothetical protein
MSELETASEHVAAAADAAESGGDRLADLAAQLESLAAGDRHADHGRLARIQSALDAVRDDAGETAAADIDAADDAIDAYRETLEGV